MLNGKRTEFTAEEFPYVISVRPLRRETAKWLGIAKTRNEAKRICEMHDQQRETAPGPP